MPLYRIGKTWYVDIATARGRIRRSARTQDRREAQAYHDRLRRELWRVDQLGEQPTVTWGEAVKRWMKEKTPALPDRYRVRKLLIPLQEPLPISDTWIKKYSEGRSSGSFNRLLTVVKTIHKINGIAPPNIKKLPVIHGRTRYLSKQEWGRLKKALQSESPLLAQAAEFALSTGLRENNVLNLEWEQVDLKRRIALLHADQVKNRTTLGIPLNDAAMAVLKARKGKNKVWVFAHPESGKPLYKASNRAWYAAVKKAKLTGFRWHDLRHTFASWAVQNGVTLRELMELGGWKSYSMVIRYSHLAKDHLAEAAAKIRPI